MGPALGRHHSAYIVVDKFLTVPGHRHVFAADDAAAVPDLTKAGRLADDRPVCAAEGSAVARNVAAT